MIHQRLLHFLKSKLKPDPYKGLSTHERFKTIYENNDWTDTESVSGPGSAKSQTEEVKRIVESVISSYSIQSILDVPCGDFGWMNEVDLQGASYVGGDIVEPLIQSNQKKFSQRSDVQFQIMDLISDPLPKADLLIVRDCLVHLSDELILKALDNIKKSEAKWLLTTTFTSRSFNPNIHTGDWRPINLQKPPFNLGNPEKFFSEKCTENEGKFKDKSLALWEINTL